MSTITTEAEELLPWTDVRPLAGDIGRATAWRMQKRGEFPSPVSVSPGRVAWRLSDIKAWQSARFRAEAA